MAGGGPGTLGRYLVGSVLPNVTRDTHSAKVIVDLMSSGESVFAAAGSSHAVKPRKILESFESLD